MFSHHASVLSIGIAPVLFAQSVTLCALCPDWSEYVALLSARWHWKELIGCSCLHALTRLCWQQSVLKRHRKSVAAATFPATVLSWFKLDLKERATTKEIKHKPEQKQEWEDAAELLPNESHATADNSFLAREQKLPTAALTWLECLLQPLNQFLILMLVNLNDTLTFSGLHWICLRLLYDDFKVKKELYYEFQAVII